MLVMGLYDFDIDIVAEGACCNFGKFETKIYANTHVRCQHNRTFFPCTNHPAPFGFLKSGSTDHDTAPSRSALPSILRS